MEQKRIRDLKRGEFFTLRDYGEYPDSARVYVRDEYERSEKNYWCYKADDWNATTLKSGNKLVYVGFTF